MLLSLNTACQEFLSCAATLYNGLKWFAPEIVNESFYECCCYGSVSWHLLMFSGGISIFVQLWLCFWGLWIQLARLFCRIVFMPWLAALCSFPFKDHCYPEHHKSQQSGNTVLSVPVAATSESARQDDLLNAALIARFGALQATVAHFYPYYQLLESIGLSLGCKSETVSWLKWIHLYFMLYHLVDFLFTWQQAKFIKGKLSEAF